VKDLPEAATNETPAEDGSQDEAKKTRIHPSTAAINKLISVVEIIKRKYIEQLDGEMLGLYQYNELGCLEDYNLMNTAAARNSNSEEARSNEILAALQGYNKCVIEFTRFM
jgi:hypothetical protein